MEIKYEPVFGDQSLFDSAVGTINEDALIILAKNDYKVFFSDISDAFSWMQQDESYRSKCIDKYAMRRIIRTPTWTVADQKAGKLPEEGCRIYVPMMLEEQNVIYSSEKVIVSISDDEGAVTRTEVGAIDRIKPIESPEEKAARLRDEWVEKAVGATPVYEIASHGYSTRLKIDISSIYDAMISGDLPVPAKGE